MSTNQIPSLVNGSVQPSYTNYLPQQNDSTYFTSSRPINNSYFGNRGSNVSVVIQDYKTTPYRSYDNYTGLPYYQGYVNKPVSRDTSNDNSNYGKEIPSYSSSKRSRSKSREKDKVDLFDLAISKPSADPSDSSMEEGADKEKDKNNLKKLKLNQIRQKWRKRNQVGSQDKNSEASKRSTPDLEISNQSKQSDSEKDEKNHTSEKVKKSDSYHRKREHSRDRHSHSKTASRNGIQATERNTEQRYKDSSPPLPLRFFLKDYSPSRRHRYGRVDSSPLRRIRHDVRDSSPPRRFRHVRGESSPRRYRYDATDSSSPLRHLRYNSTDSSPTRRTRHDTSSSPIRRTRHDTSSSPTRRLRHDTSSSPIRRLRHDTSSSPTRRTRHDTSSSPTRRLRHDTSGSPTRRTRHDTSSSPTRRTRYDTSSSPTRRSRHTSSSPTRRTRHTSSSPTRCIRRDTTDSSMTLNLDVDLKDVSPIKRVRHDTPTPTRDELSYNQNKHSSSNNQNKHSSSSEKGSKERLRNGGHNWSRYYSRRHHSSSKYRSSRKKRYSRSQTRSRSRDRRRSKYGNNESTVEDGELKSSDESSLSDINSEDSVKERPRSRDRSRDKSITPDKDSGRSQTQLLDKSFSPGSLVIISESETSLISSPKHDRSPLNNSSSPVKKLFVDEPDLLDATAKSSETITKSPNRESPKPDAQVVTPKSDSDNSQRICELEKQNLEFQKKIIELKLELDTKNKALETFELDSDAKIENLNETYSDEVEMLKEEIAFLKRDNDRERDFTDKSKAKEKDLLNKIGRLEDGLLHSGKENLELREKLKKLEEEIDSLRYKKYPVNYSSTTTPRNYFDFTSK